MVVTWNSSLLSFLLEAFARTAQGSKWDAHLKRVLCGVNNMVNSSWRHKCKAVRPGRSDRSKKRLTGSETDLNTILRCFLSFKTVILSRNILLFKIFFPRQKNDFPSHRGLVPFSGTRPTYWCTTICCSLPIPLWCQMPLRQSPLHVDALQTKLYQCRQSKPRAVFQELKRDNHHDMLPFRTIFQTLKPESLNWSKYC